jgi:hypothetical protein
LRPFLIEILKRLSSSTQENSAEVDENDDEDDEEVLVAAKALEIGIRRDGDQVIECLQAIFGGGLSD